MSTDRKTVSTESTAYGYQGDDVETRGNQSFSVENGDGTKLPLDLARLEQSIAWASRGYEEIISRSLIIQETLRNAFDGITHLELSDALVLATVAFIERDPAYSYVASRLLIKKLFKSITNSSMRTKTEESVKKLYKKAFVDGITYGVDNNTFDKRMLDFDLERLAQGLCIERDDLFGYMGTRTLYERYFVKKGQRRFELPQNFWMRVSMGIALLKKENKTDRALEFYNALSTMRYVPSTPTLLHSGLTRAQLSSCFLGTVGDDLTSIFKCLGDNAQLSKWSGGVAYDWTNIRATGSMVKSIKTESQGLIPFLKIANDVTAAINRSGKRRSAACVYLETWHLDIEDFLDLRRNTGDERRRTHDINTANWIPDLFIKRVLKDEKWTLFSPDEVPELHHIYGKKFEKRYCEYEVLAQEGKLTKFKEVEATKLWRKMLSRLFETGHPWITFKDSCNVRSPQDHVGVIHNSNLCTEITLNTSLEETAVCNLGSVNLAQHIVDGVLDDERLGDTISTALRMLDNVIDINFYPTKEAKTANMRHRPVGLGTMGLQDALYKMNLAFDSPQALAFTSEVQEKISYNAILSSSKLAQEKGTYESYKGSKWDRNIFPQDTIDLLEKERGMPINVKRGGILDWTPVREHVKKHGMRNSNTMAIAPTATISTIAGCFPCIEPIYKNLYVKANMSGEFTVINHYLVNDLKKAGLWNKQMLDEIKYYDGSIQSIERIPQHLKDKYKEAFEIDPEWLVNVTAQRGQWIDQSQSHNVFMKGVSGKKLHKIYIAAWQAGLKTMYYLRTLGATQIEKSTLDAKKFGYTQKRVYQSAESERAAKRAASKLEDADSQDQQVTVRACSLSQDPDCDVCQ